ncbi:MAG: response regulator transcription factor [Rhodothermales bacterium]
MGALSIVLVGDSAPFQKKLTAFLERHLRFEVVGKTANGNEALALASTRRPDLILCDLSISGLSGMEIIKQLRATLPATRIIAFTLYDNIYYQQAALQAGADAFVSKIELGSEMVASIRRLCPDAQVSETSGKS